MNSRPRLRLTQSPIFSLLLSADTKESLLSAQIQFRAVGYILAFRQAPVSRPGRIWILAACKPKGTGLWTSPAQLVQQPWMWSKVKNPVFCFQCFLLPWRVGRRNISKPCALALQLVISMCSFELLQPTFLPGCLCGDEASQRSSVYPQPRCQGIKCLLLCPLLHLWIII